VNRKIFVLDTSAIIALVQDVTTFPGAEVPRFAGVLGDNEIIIPRVVLDELHELRSAMGEKGKAALEAARQMEGYINEGSLVEGVETEKGGLLKIVPRPDKRKVADWGSKASAADREILATALETREIYSNHEGVPNGSPGQGPRVILISQDRILRVLARSVYGLEAEELKSVCTSELEYERGYRRIEVDGSEIDRIMNEGSYETQELPLVNQFYHLVDRENPDVHYCYAMARENAARRVHLIDRTKVDYLKVAGEVSGRNVRQKLLLWALMGCGDPDPMSPAGIRLITISGPAGSGKSFLTLAAAWERLERGHF